MEKLMLRKNVARFAGIAAAVAAVTMGAGPAFARPSMVPEGGLTGRPPAGAMAPAPQKAAATQDLTQELAAARLATAKYATNLNRAKADGYGIITMMMPNMGFHFM